MARKNHEFLKYLKDLLRKVEEETGASIKWTAKPKLATAVHLQYAQHGRVHRVEYRSELRPHLTHILVNSAYKVLRFWKAADDEKVVPAFRSPGRLPSALERELADKSKTKLRMASQLSGVLFEGMVRHLTTMPPDVRVEKDIHAELRQHRELQEEYLTDMVRKAEVAVLPMVYRYAPKQLCDATIAMNVVYAEQASEMTGLQLSNAYRSVSCKNLVGQLGAHLRSVDVPGYKGDCEGTDRWATTVGMRDWYFWKPFESAGRPDQSQRTELDTFDERLF